MMMMAEEPERRRQIPAPMSTTVAVPSPQERASIRIITEAATSSSSSTGTDPPEDKISKGEGSEGYPVITERTTGGSNNEDEAEAGDTEDSQSDEVVNYSINPNSLSTPSPSSPAGSLKSNGGGGANSVTRRIFTPEFKQSVLEAFTNDPDCIGNQRATARKFGIHRRQVQKWLQHIIGTDTKDQNSSDEQEQKIKKDKDTELSYPTDLSPASSSESQLLSGEPSNNLARKSVRSRMPIIAGKTPLLPQASSNNLSSHSSQSPSLPSTSQLPNLGKNMGSLHHSLFSSTSPNMFSNLPHSLLTGNASAPHSFDNSRHSPRHSPLGHSSNGSPQNGNVPSPQKMTELIDELYYLYPSEDFSMLRRAMLTNEVTFVKIKEPLKKHVPNNHTASSSNPTNHRPHENSTTNNYITQQTLQMIKRQNEYLQFLQSGYANLPNMSPEASVEKFVDHNGDLSAWISVPAFNLPSLGKTVNGSAEQIRKKNHEANLIHHTFAPPKAPVTNSKSKTVAAVLAASRRSPNLSPNCFEKPKKPSQRRKPNNYRQTKSSTITRLPNNEQDDFIDPTSMLEVVTTKPSSYNSNYNFLPSESQGMDLSTTASPVTQGTNNIMTTTSTLRSKAMNKDYGFLSDLGLVRKNKSPTNGNRHQMLSSTASLEHFVQNVLPQRKPSPPVTESSSSRSPPSNDTNSGSSSESTDRTKNLVLEAFNFDSELQGDARGVARKFGLNIRVVQKWIREAPTRSIPPSEIPPNGGVSMIMGSPIRAVLNSLEEHNDEADNFRIQVKLEKHGNGPTVNKRKNPKPNQICDFTEDIEDNCPLDMVVPIKKRRVSTPTPTSV